MMGDRVGFGGASYEQMFDGFYHIDGFKFAFSGEDGGWWVCADQAGWIPGSSRTLEGAMTIAREANGLV